MKQKNLDNESAEEKKAWGNFIETFYKVAYKGFMVQSAAPYESLIKDAINIDAESNPQGKMKKHFLDFQISKSGRFFSSE